MYSIQSKVMKHPFKKQGQTAQCQEVRQSIDPVSEMTPVGTFKQVPQNNYDQNGKASSGKCGQHESKN